MEVSWWGALGMDAERAPLRQGWRVGASPHHDTGAKEPLRSRGRTSAQMVFVYFAETKWTRPSGRNLDKPHRRCCCCYPIQKAIEP